MDKIFDSNIHLAGGSAWRSVSGFDLNFLKKTLLKSVSSLGEDILGHITETGCPKNTYCAYN